MWLGVLVFERQGFDWLNHIPICMHLCGSWNVFKGWVRVRRTRRVFYSAINWLPAQCVCNHQFTVWIFYAVCSLECDSWTNFQATSWQNMPDSPLSTQDTAGTSSFSISSVRHIWANRASESREALLGVSWAPPPTSIFPFISSKCPPELRTTWTPEGMFAVLRHSVVGKMLQHAHPGIKNLVPWLFRELDSLWTPVWIGYICLQKNWSSNMTVGRGGHCLHKQKEES